jgi:hypothetical protein
LGPDELGRVALTDVVDFVDARSELSQYRSEGQTFVGCRIRAFNRLDEYLPQTINESYNVTYGEFLNETFQAETIRNFIQYSIIPKNYYLDDMAEGFAELTVPLPKCGHMWVTKRDGRLCFNNGCVVETPDPRQYLASNGYVRVVSCRRAHILELIECGKGEMCGLRCCFSWYYSYLTYVSPFSGLDMSLTNAKFVPALPC